jgi:hypothetical protein
LPEAPGGLPARSQLGWSARLILEASAISDIGLRTMATGLVTASMVPFLTAPGSLRTERNELGFYRELAARRDPALSFPRPKTAVEVKAARVVPLSFRPIDGRVELLRFASPFVAVNPSQRERYGRFARNRTAYAQYWRHDDGPRPTLCVIHGFMGSPYWFNSAFFALPWFYGHGYDVLLYTLPFHGRRQSGLSPYSGHGFFAHGVGHLNEAVAHAVHDFRLFVDHLESRGVDKIGVTGLSLGGYMTALLAALEDRLYFAIPNAAVTNLAELVNQWFPAGQLINVVLRCGGAARAEIDQALAVHCPLTYPPALPKERLMIIAGLGDRLAPPEQSEQLWQHWDHCALHWFPGNHVLHVNRAAYLRQIGRFMQRTGFSD